MNKYVMILLLLFSVIWPGGSANGAIIVGRISHAEGPIYRYLDVDDSWVETVEQAPAGSQDILMTGSAGRAEIIFPNDMQVRLDRQTEIEILNLDEDGGEFSLHAGRARFYNRSTDGRLIVETGRGTLQVSPGGVIDMQADRQSTTVSAVFGEAAFYSYDNGSEKIDIISGTTSLEFRPDSTIATRGPLNKDWSRWCGDREGVWGSYRTVRSEHLPETMQEYAYDLEPYGRWQKVYYRGYYYWAWSPYSITVGWSPYTTGYWYDWQGSPVWIDNNPWGWVTHHYGYWIDVSGIWLWTPYIHVSHDPGVTVIGFNITFGKRYRPYWHPGRVRWISRSDYIGWLPLTPWETYYGYRGWGPRSVVVSGGVGVNININLSSHRYLDHAVVIPKRSLYDRHRGEHGNYERVRVRNINKTAILKDYKPLSLTDEGRHGRYAAEAGRAGNMKERNNRRREARDGDERQFRAPENHQPGESRSFAVNRDRPTENFPAKTRLNDKKRTGVEKYAGPNSNEREKIKQQDVRSGIVRALPQKRQEKAAGNDNVAVQEGAGYRENNRRRSFKAVSTPAPDKSGGRPFIETGREGSAAREKQNVLTGKNRRAEERSARLTQKEQERDRNYRYTISDNGRRGRDNVREEVEKQDRPRSTEGNSVNLRERSALGSRRGFDTGRRNWEANAFNGRGIR